jgi:hypothetical protein
MSEKVRAMSAMNSAPERLDTEAVMGTFAVARTIAGGNPPVIPVDRATGAVSG